MKRSDLKEFIREEIIATLSEETMVDKTTDLNKASDIARGIKKDPNTVRAAITQAKTSGKPITIAEDDEDDEITQHARKIAKDLSDKQDAKDSKKDEKKDIKSLLKGIKEDIDKAVSLDEAKNIIRKFMKDMHMDEDKRYKNEKIMLRSLLEDKYFSQFIKHFYNLILKFEGLGSPDSKKGKGGSYSGDEWGNANPKTGGPKGSSGGAGSTIDIAALLKSKGL